MAPLSHAWPHGKRENRNVRSAYGELRGARGERAILQDLRALIYRLARESRSLSVAL